MSGADDIKDKSEEEDPQVSPLDLPDDELLNMSLEDLPEGDDTTGDDDDDAEQSGTESSDDGESGSGSETGSDDDGADQGASGDDAESTGDDGTGSDDDSGADGTDEGGSDTGSESDDDTGDGESGSTDSELGEGRDPHSGKSSETDKDDKSGKSESKTEKSEQSENNQLNFEDEHKKLLAPFRANGKDMQVKNVEDARTLMQMGANYNKKMAGLKPNLKLIKMLDNNDLLDEGKLSFLIDLDKKNPEAIKKLIKDSGLDLDEFDQDAEHNYESNTYTVDDKEVELDGVIEDIKDTASFNETINIISNKWDGSSKKVFAGNPNLIKVINQHVAAGVFSKIETAVEQERMLGKLEGMDDLAAYMHMGDRLHDLGVFNNMGKKETKDKVDTSETNTEKAQKPVDSKTRQKKKAASSTKAASSKKGKENFNPLALSDEDFDKVSGSDFL